MGKRIIVILVSLLFLYSFGIDDALSQANGSRPPGVPEFIGGGATIEGQSAQGGEVCLKIASPDPTLWLCIIFLDGLDDQGSITSIVDGLNATPAITAPLTQAFLNSTFCQNYDPPLELSGPATVHKISATEWEVTDPSGRFYVFTENIKIRQGSSWVTGKKLQVNMYNCKIASSPIGGGSSLYSLVLEVNNLPVDIWWGDNTYTLIDPGSANVGNTGYFYIKKDGIERRVTKINDQETGSAPHYIVGDAPFSILALDAPESIPLSISLCQGFNLFSVPFHPLNPDLDVALAGIMASMDSILALRDGQWKVSAPNPGGGWAIDQVKNLNGAEAYVIYMKNAAVLDLAGIPLAPGEVPVTLQQGFNLAPYNSMVNDNPVEVAFASIRDDVDTFLKYNCEEGKWKACVPNPAGGWLLKQFSVVSPGDGLVIYLKAVSSVWNVEP